MLARFGLAYRAAPPRVGHNVIRLPVRLFVFFRIKSHILEPDIGKLPAMRAFGAPLFLCALHVRVLNFARSLDCRRRGLDNFSVVAIRFCAPLSQLDGVALRARAQWKSVNFVKEDVPDRLARQVGRAVCADNRQTAARKQLHRDGVRAVAPLCAINLLSERRTGGNHRRYASFGIVLRHAVCRLHIKHRAGVVVNRLSHHVQLDFAFAYLRA